MGDTGRPLDAAAMLAGAQAVTGLSDWGDATLPERFTAAVDHLNGAGMDAAGQRQAASVCHGLLTSRLEFFEDRRRYPIADEVIEAPMFVTGEPRTGTTLMHALMSVDPQARALRFWEVMYPSGPPGVAGADDPRRDLADDDWREINAKLPKWLHSHPYNDMLGDGLPEDERTWAFDFRVMTPTTWWRVPMPTVVQGLPTDAAAQYRIHRMMLQQFQFNRPTKYWVLKGFHGFRLREFFDAYPDAGLVWLHRDPVQVAASRTMMMADILDGIVGPVDLKAAAKMHLELTRASIANTMSNPLTDDPRILHVRYSDFVSDQIATVRHYYAFTGRELTQQAENAMRTYLADNKGDRHGKFRYSTTLLTDIGENLDALHEEFRPFRERFGVEVENLGLGVHPRVSLHQVAFLTESTTAFVEHCRTLGVQHLTLVTPMLLRPGGVEEAQRALAGGGPRVAQVNHPFAVYPDLDGDDGQATEKLNDAIDIAVTLGAAGVYLLTGGRGSLNWERAADRFAGLLAPCKERASRLGVTLLVENASPFYADIHIAHTLADTITLAATAGIGVCIDFHACWTEAGLNELVERAMPVTGLIQVSDYVLGDRTAPCRAVPGDGAIPLERIMGAVLDAGYPGVFDVELVGPRIDAEGPHSATARAAQRISDILTTLGA